MAKAATLVKAKRFDDAVEELLAVEKKARQACDATSVSKLLRQVLLRGETKGSKN